MKKKELDLLIDDYGFSNNKIEIHYDNTIKEQNELSRYKKYLESKGFKVLTSTIGRLIGLVAWRK